MQIDITGQRFGKLTALRPSYQRNGYWLCKCDCGTIKEVKGCEMRRGRVRSCGCLLSLYSPTEKKPHGLHSSGRKIRYIRQRKGITALELSQACGVTKSALIHWENGVRNVDDEIITNVAQVMNIDAAALIDRKIRNMGDVIHILFEIADDGFIEPETGNIHVKNSALRDAMVEWHEKYSQWKSKQITNEEYYDWQDAYTFTAQSENTEDK